MNDTNISVSTTRNAVHQLIHASINDLAGPWSDIIDQKDPESLTMVRETLDLLQALCLQSGLTPRDVPDMSDMIDELNKLDAS